MEYSDRGHVNCIKWNVSNTFLHEFGKAIIAWNMLGGMVPVFPKDFDINKFVADILIQTGHIEKEDFVMEARDLRKKRRYDIFGLRSRIFELETGRSYDKTDNVETVRI